MQTEIDYKYGDIKLTLLVDYDDDGTSLEDVLHKGESIIEILADWAIQDIRYWVSKQHTELLEADKMARAEEAWERRKDK